MDDSSTHPAPYPHRFRGCTPGRPDPRSGQCGCGWDRVGVGVEWGKGNTTWNATCSSTYTTIKRASMCTPSTGPGSTAQCAPGAQRAKQAAVYLRAASTSPNCGQEVQLVASEETEREGMLTRAFIFVAHEQRHLSKASPVAYLQKEGLIGFDSHGDLQGSVVRGVSGRVGA